MSIKNLTEKVKEFLLEVFGKNAEIIAVMAIENGWKVTAEMVLDEEYTNKRARNDLVYVFEVITDKQQNVISYERTRIRERGRIEEQ